MCFNQRVYSLLCTVYKYETFFPPYFDSKYIPNQPKKHNRKHQSLWQNWIKTRFPHNTFYKVYMMIAMIRLLSHVYILVVLSYHPFISFQYSPHYTTHAFLKVMRLVVDIQIFNGRIEMQKGDEKLWSGRSKNSLS